MKKKHISIALMTIALILIGISHEVYATSPVMILANMSPSTIYTNITIQGFCNATDVNNTNLSYRVQWFRNEVSYNTTNRTNVLPNISVNADNISAFVAKKNENWTFSCQAFEVGSGSNSSWLNSTPINISNSPPYIISSVLNSTTNTRVADLQLFCNGYDVDGDNVTYAYQFFKNATINQSQQVAQYGLQNPCYQEFANISTSCGGLSTGSYGISNISNTIYVNYSKPYGATSDSKFQYYSGSSVNSITNISFKTAVFGAAKVYCWDPSPTIVQITDVSYWTVAGNFMSISYQCNALAVGGGHGLTISGYGNQNPNNGYTFNSPNVTDSYSPIDGNYNTGAIFSQDSGYWATTSPSAGLFEEGIYWFFGIPSNVTTNVQNISNSSLIKGQNWTGTCYATDGFSNSTFINTTSLQIANIAPQVVNNSALITSIFGGVNCTYTYYDVDGDPQSGTTYRWFKNNTLLSSTLVNLTSGNFTSNDQLICEITPKDSGSSGIATNSSIYVANDTTPPSITDINIASTGTIATPITISLNCSDQYTLASGYPLAQWTNPNQIVEGNFTMSLNGAGLYEKSYTFSIVGVYTNFTFYCADGSGNLNTSRTSYSITITPQGSSVSGGGGAPPAVILESPVDFEVSPISKSVSSYIGVDNIEEFQVINKGSDDLYVNISLNEASDPIAKTFVDFSGTGQSKINVLVKSSNGLISGTSYIRYNIKPPLNTTEGSYRIIFDITSGTVTHTHSVIITAKTNFLSPFFAFVNIPLLSTDIPCQSVFGTNVSIQNETAISSCNPISIIITVGNVLSALLLIIFVIYGWQKIKSLNKRGKSYG